MLCFLKAYGFATPFSTGIVSSTNVFYALWGIANGPLGGGVLAWRNSLVLHDLQHMAGCFIHLSPVIVTWTMRWKAGEYNKRWPLIFGMPKSYLNFYETSFLDVFIPAASIYFAWLFVYIIWIIVYGRF